MGRYAQDRGPNWMTVPDAQMPIARATTDEGNSTAEVSHTRNYVWNSGSGSWDKMTQPGGTGTGSGDGAILDGVSATIKATVLDYTNSNPLAVRLTDTNGDYIAAGAGTQYVEDVAAPTDPTGTAIAARRRDTLAAETTTDGDWVAANATNKGELYVKHVDSIPVSYGSGTFTVGGTVTANQGGAWTVAGGANVFHVDDNGGLLSVDDGGGSLTVDGTVAATQSGSWVVDTELPTAAAIAADNQAAPTAPSVYGFNMTWDGAAWDRQPTPLTDTQLRATAVPVSGSGTFTVSGTVTANQGGSWTVAGGANVFHVDDNGTTLSIDDGAGSITVDGTVTANPATAMGKTITYVSVNQGVAGTTVLAAASPGNKHKIIGAFLTMSADGTLKFSDGAGDLSGAMNIAANGGFVLPTSIIPHQQTSIVNTALNLVTTVGLAKGVVAILTEA